jgi:P27 family predicted phage terminase small subunit
MAKVGRPRIADAEKAKRGTLQKCRIRDTAIKDSMLDGLPEPPEFLNEIGAKEWREKVSILDKMKMLHATDLGMLAALCKEFQNYVSAEMDTRDKPRYYALKDDGGKVRYWGVHPVHSIAQQHLKAYIQLCNEFGFSPASRSSIGIKAEPKKEASILDFMTVAKKAQ